jgi:hypothetical protein
VFCWSREISMGTSPMQEDVSNIERILSFLKIILNWIRQHDVTFKEREQENEEEEEISYAF